MINSKERVRNVEEFISQKLQYSITITFFKIFINEVFKFIQHSYITEIFISFSLIP